MTREIPASLGGQRVICSGVLHMLRAFEAADYPRDDQPLSFEKCTTLSHLSSRQSTTSGTAYANAYRDLVILPERPGDPQGLVRNLGAWRRETS